MPDSATKEGSLSGSYAAIGRSWTSRSSGLLANSEATPAPAASIPTTTAATPARIHLWGNSSNDQTTPRIKTTVKRGVICDWNSSPKLYLESGPLLIQLQNGDDLAQSGIIFTAHF